MDFYPVLCSAKGDLSFKVPSGGDVTVEGLSASQNYRAVLIRTISDQKTWRMQGGHLGPISLGSLILTFCC